MIYLSKYPFKFTGNIFLTREKKIILHFIKGRKVNFTFLLNVEWSPISGTVLEKTNNQTGQIVIFIFKGRKFFDK